MESNATESAVSSDQLRITVEIGEGYAPTPRVAAALDELADALQEAADQGEVEGFGFGAAEMSFDGGTSYLFDSLSAGERSLERFDGPIKIPAPPAPFVKFR